MAPTLHVLTSEYRHRYHRLLYAPLLEHVTILPFQRYVAPDRAKLAEQLSVANVFHLHWPEWLLGPEPALHETLIELLHEAGVEIVWTQHNLLPHSQAPVWTAIYQLWADATGGVVHHSEWGREHVLGFRSFRPGAIHRVIPHGHWGSLIEDGIERDRGTLAASFQLDGEHIHLGVVGTPRPQKDVQLVVEGFIDCDRNDLDLIIFSLGPGETVPAHPRIKAFPYAHVPREEYNRRLCLIDVLILPLRADGSMLTTGLVGDVIGAAKPALVSDWPYLTETLGPAGIVFGSSAEDFRNCLSKLDTDAIATAATASRELQTRYSWDVAAALTLQLLEDVGAAK